MNDQLLKVFFKRKSTLFQSNKTLLFFLVFLILIRETDSQNIQKLSLSNDVAKINIETNQNKDESFKLQIFKLNGVGICKIVYNTKQQNLQSSFRSFLFLNQENISFYKSSEYQKLLRNESIQKYSENIQKLNKQLQQQQTGESYQSDSIFQFQDKCCSNMQLKQRLSQNIKGFCMFSVVYETKTILITFSMMVINIGIILFLIHYTFPFHQQLFAKNIYLRSIQTILTVSIIEMIKIILSIIIYIIGLISLQWKQMMIYLLQWILTISQILFAIILGSIITILVYSKCFYTANQHFFQTPKNSSVNRKIQCCICLQNNIQLITDCQHYFHVQCYLKCLQIKRQCPSCRQRNKFIYFRSFCCQCSRLIINATSISVAHNLDITNYYLKRYCSSTLKDRKLIYIPKCLNCYKFNPFHKVSDLTKFLFQIFFINNQANKIGYNELIQHKQQEDIQKILNQKDQSSEISLQQQNLIY